MENRIIKFRALKDDMSNCNWVYGCLVYDAAGVPRITEVDKSGEGLTFHTCLKGTEAQFTCLLDKNGKEIFEGDIIKSTFCKTSLNDEKTIIAIVKYDTVNPCFVMEYKYNGNGHLCHEYDFVQCDMRTNEVIGNIHENPELLKTE